MSILEKAMNLLQTMPENKLDIVYAYMRFVSMQENDEDVFIPKKEKAESILGLAHEYANPDLIPLEKEAFANAMAEKHVPH